MSQGASFNVQELSPLICNDPFGGNAVHMICTGPLWVMAALVLCLQGRTHGLNEPSLGCEDPRFCESAHSTVDGNDGFLYQTVLSAADRDERPTNLDFTPDGRLMFVARKNVSNIACCVACLRTVEWHQPSLLCVFWLVHIHWSHLRSARAALPCECLTIIHAHRPAEGWLTCSVYAR